jgi:hypothetical protein
MAQCATTKADCWTLSTSSQFKSRCRYLLLLK